MKIYQNIKNIKNIKSKKIMKIMKKRILIVLMTGLSLYSSSLCADDSPPGSINAFTLALDASKHSFSQAHLQFIGVCTWLHWSIFGPYVTVTPEVQEYLPDLTVSVYNEAGDDPWFYARDFIDKAAHAAGSSLMKAATGNDLTDGRSNSVPAQKANSSEITKSVDVVGTPYFYIPWPPPYFLLNKDTTAFVPYYLSDVDTMGKLGIAEKLRKETWDPFGHYIGKSFADHWAYEFPREMTVDSDNDYKASLSIALHAADIATNAHKLHVITKDIDDSCGSNCAVSSVVEEQSDDSEQWEEVYPNDRPITLGDSDVTSKTPIGVDDYKAGNGNYVFMIWRKYKGCVQSPGGSILFDSTTVPPTNKR
jgi:integrating conjugative element protein (TIGR03756 family)